MENEFVFKGGKWIYESYREEGLVLAQWSFFIKITDIGNDYFTKKEYTIIEQTAGKNLKNNYRLSYDREISRLGASEGREPDPLDVTEKINFLCKFLDGKKDFDFSYQPPNPKPFHNRFSKRKTQPRRGGGRVQAHVRFNIEDPLKMILQLLEWNNQKKGTNFVWDESKIDAKWKFPGMEISKMGFFEHVVSFNKFKKL